MNELDEHVVITLSEDDIRKDYYPFWKKLMYKKYVDENYSFDDCLIDFTTVHLAWKVNECL